MMNLYFAGTRIWDPGEMDFFFLGVVLFEKFIGELIIARLYDEFQDRCTMRTTIVWSGR